MLWTWGNVDEGRTGGRVDDKWGYKTLKPVPRPQACRESQQGNAYLCLLLNVKLISIFQPSFIMGKRSSLQDKYKLWRSSQLFSNGTLHLSKWKKTSCFVSSRGGWIPALTLDDSASGSVFLWSARQSPQVGMEGDGWSPRAVHS